ncbi:MAG: hypothetical protein GY749_49605, partial [Desulfobacteraceae bacterium]|nr:hypothetical protein [Desulfobacteraceae bacterium]
MKYRAAFVVENQDELIEKLSLFANDQIPGNGGELSEKEKLPADQNSDICEFAERWVRGADADWDTFYKGHTPQRISLPTYPFLKERYWINDRSSVIKERLSVGDSKKSEKITDDNQLPLTKAGQYEIIVSYIQNTTGRILGFAASQPPPADQGFFDMGLESVQALELGTEIDEKFGVELYATVLFDYPTIRELSQYVLEHMPANRTKADKLIHDKEERSASEIVYYRCEWEESDIVPKKTTEYPDGCFLLFDTGADTHNALKERLKKDGLPDIRVILVKPGENFRHIGNDVYEIRPEHQDDYEQLADSFINRDQKVTRIIHMWSQGHFGGTGKELDRQLEKGIYSVYYLTRALMLQKIKHKVRMLYIFPGGKDEPQRAYPQVGGLTENPPCPRSHAPRGNAGCSAPRGYPQGEICPANLSP